MKKLILATVIVTASASLCSAQRATGRKSGADAAPAPPPAAGALIPPPSPGPGKAAGLPAPPPPRAMAEMKTVSGRVAGLAANDDYVYDGFWMMNGSDSILVKFPPHMGKQVVGMVQEGTEVSVSGRAGKSPMGTSEMHLMSLSSNGKTLKDDVQPPAQAVTPPAETEVKGSGQVISLQKDRGGRVHGLILDNGTILRIGPGAGSALDNLSSSAAISYAGMQHARNGNEALAKDYKIVHCRSVTVNGKQYTM